ncbi:aminotransferase class I/II-fold pyridoxal phosphate-dependent enzyme [Pedobacter arcticus]|uniref:aminotransferase class I/II-fold pyridoxal phosphate-dependent enzyme n=1 Tax=Pedobacter arcticus TaxID=752140 RepID=UPI0002FF5F15|nr:8-amino-7-oxononanoate synthase [Pedobacter arcticus]
MENFLQEKLTERQRENSLRELHQYQEGLADFFSNDYLSFAQSICHKQKIQQLLDAHPNYKNGATGSRLISGNTKFAEELEQKIADFHQAEAVLIFNSGYDANVGLLSSIAQRGDTIICDELIHASLIDGARLSLANRYTFAHNDLRALEEKLKQSKGNIFVVTESVFSMDGDCAPLLELSELTEKYKANLIVDEAHALGVFGKYGEGLTQHLNLQHKVFARIYTFGKALGCHGAAVVGSTLLRQYLINFARSFIYTTALPYHALACIAVGYEEITKTSERALLLENIRLFTRLTSRKENTVMPSASAIQSILVPGNEACKKLATQLQKSGFNVKAILSPTVAKGKERLRICLHAHNTKAEIYELTSQLNINHD